MHIGYDEETAKHQDASGRCLYVAVRKGELWMRDFLHIVRTVEKNGMRPWAWSDYGWEHPEFYERCPKSVLMSNWFYDECYEGFDLAKNKSSDQKRLKGFYDLDKAGFEQVPCGTNWAGWRREKLNVGADDVMGKLVALCRRDITPQKLKGFMMAPWAGCDNDAGLQKNIRGVDILADALRT